MIVRSEIVIREAVPVAKLRLCSIAFGIDAAS